MRERMTKAGGDRIGRHPPSTSSNERTPSALVREQCYLVRTSVNLNDVLGAPPPDAKVSNASFPVATARR